MSSVADEKLQCLILDENKVVTYKTASRYLKVHAQEAKKILTNFYNVYKSEHSLNAYYFVVGVSEENGSKGFKASVVSSTELEDVKSSFPTSPSYHIYCVFKGEELDKNTLYAADYDEDLKWDLSRLSHISNPSVDICSGKLSKPVTASNSVDVKSDPVKRLPSRKEEPKAPAKSNSTGIMSIFQNQKKSSASSKPVSKNEPQKPVVVDSGSETKSGGENVMKGTSTNKTAKKNKNDVRHLFSNQSEKSSKVSESTSSLKSNVEQTKDAKNMQKKHQGKRTKSNLSSHSEDSDFDNSKSKKRHKRIMTIEDSSSESENEESRDMAQRNVFAEKKAEVDNEEKVDKEETVDNEDEEELIPPTPPSSNYKTMIKTINTFSTDGEFLVTKKEKQCVTVLDEDVKPSKPKVFKEPVLKKVPLNKKQSSLISFFKQR